MKSVTLKDLRSLARHSDPHIKKWLDSNPSFRGLVSTKGDLYISAGFDARQRDALISLLKRLKIKGQVVTVERGIYDSFVAAPNGFLEEEKIENKSLREIINKSITQRVTDIHINIKTKRATIRFKIDGFMYLHQELDTTVCYQIVSSLFQSRIGKNFELKSAMDEEFSWDYQDRSFIFRVHSTPGFHGTVVVLRAREQNKYIEIEDAGYHLSQQQTLIQMTKNSTGFGCISGSTNSGKSTTYASLMKSIPDTYSMIELANPIEMEIPGVEQVPLKGETDADVAEAIRSVVRMDPNYLFMGEMRGRETAKLVQEMALVGQSVFTTFHAGTAELFFIRLLDIGFTKTNLLVGDFFNGFLVQTLMPRVCQHCKTDSPNYMDAENARKTVQRYKYIFDKPASFRNYEGCSRCNGTGTAGQIVVAEGFIPDYDSQDFYDIVKHNNFHKLRTDYMRPRKILGQMEHAALHVYNGIIDPVEAERKRSTFDADLIKEAFKWAL